MQYSKLHCYVCGTRIFEPNPIRNLITLLYQNIIRKKVYVVCEWCYEEKKNYVDNDKDTDIGK